MCLRFFFFLNFSFLFAANIQAQKIELQHFADLADIEKILIYHNFIWVESAGGLAQLDLEGKILQKYDLQNENISNEDRLLEGEGGEPFIFSVSQNALLRWDTTQQKWAVFRAVRREKINLHNTKQQIWIVTDDSLFLLKNEKWAAFTNPSPADYFYHRSALLEQTSKGKIYCKLPCYTSSNDNLYYWNGSNWQTKELKDATFSYLDDLFCYGDTLYDDKNRYWDGKTWQPTRKWNDCQTEVVWINGYPSPPLICDFLGNPRQNRLITQEGDIFLFEQDRIWHKEKNKSPIKTYKKAPLQLQPEEELRSICRDASGLLWLATDKGGIYKESEEGWQRLQIGDCSQATNTHKQNLFIDKDGAIWFANYQGILCYENGEWQQIQDSAISKARLWKNIEMVRFTQTENGTLYFVTHMEVFRRMPDKSWKLLFGANGFVGSYLHERGHLCVLGIRGVRYEFLENGEILQDTIPEIEKNYIFKHFYALEKGEFWLSIGTENIVYRYKNGELSQHKPSTKNDDYSYAELKVWKKSDSIIYLSLGNGRCFQLDEHTKKWSKLPLDIKDQNGQIDKSRAFWVQTRSGIFRQDTQSNTWENKSAAAVGDAEMINFLVDSRLRLWICTEAQMRVYDTANNSLLGAIDLPQKARYTQIYEGKGGEIWISSANKMGICRLQLRN